jgi:peptide/nickel transport system substrate-binding protein
MVKFVAADSKSRSMGPFGGVRSTSRGGPSMNRTRAVSLTALAAAAALVLAACGSSSDTASTTSADTAASSAEPGDSTSGADATVSAGASGGTITYAQEQEWYDYNGSSGSGNLVANNVLFPQVQRGFYFIDNVGEIQMDTEFGTMEKTSDSPLTVKYTFNDKAVWSDGAPMGCADFLLAWASASGRYNADGTINEGTERPATPAYLFDVAGTTGIDQTQKPVCADGDKTVTLVYDKPYVDWQAALAGPLGAGLLPAHVASKAAGIDNAAFVKAVETDDSVTLKKVADFWNTGWTLDPAKGLDTSLIPASGPFYIAAWDPGQSATLKKNDKWWGTPAKTDTVVVRYMSQDQEVAALQSGEVNIIEPQPSPDTTAALAALGDQVKTQFGNKYTFEHVDLSVKNGFANEKLREAFFKCAPRQQIVDNLIVPQNPDAVLLDSLTTLNFQQGYEQAAEDSGYKPYADVDIEGAKAAYAASGEAPGKAIKIVHTDPNPRRTNTVALIKASCDPVGFNVQDTPLSSDQIGPTLNAGDYDAALFSWSGSGLNGALAPLYLANGSQNTAGWNDPDVDAALNELVVTINPDDVPPLLTRIDQGMAKNFYSYPIFTFPGILATSPDIEGAKQNATQTQATWNMQEWAKSGG